MHRRTALLITLLFSSAANNAANAQPHGTPGMQDANSIRQAALRHVSSQVGPQAQLEAAVDDRLRMPGCSQPLQTANSGSSTGSRHTVAVSCAGPSAWSLYVPVKVSQRQTVLVLARNLRVGEPIDASALRQETRDIAGLGQGYFNDTASLVGKTVRRPLAAGSILTPDLVGNAASIRRGQYVTLIARAGAMEVRAEGKALADAGTGDRLAVENASSRRVVQGTVREDGLIEISF